MGAYDGSLQFNQIQPSQRLKFYIWASNCRYIYSITTYDSLSIR